LPGERDGIKFSKIITDPRGKFMVEKRRCKRLPLSIPVRVYGRTPEDHPFREMTVTKAVNVHGGLLPLAPRVKRGQKLLLVHGFTDEAREARVVYVKNGGRGKKRVGIEFISTKGDFWHVFTPVVELKRARPSAA
jgi:hypothetical protein